LIQRIDSPTVGRRNQPRRSPPDRRAPERPRRSLPDRRAPEPCAGAPTAN